MEGNRRVLFDAAKEMQSPRFRAILRATSGRRRRTPADVKSFSHELNSGVSRNRPIRKLHGLSCMEDIMKVVKPKFNRLKQEVNAELGVVASDLVGTLEKANAEHPDWRASIEDLLVTSQKCAEMSPDEFWTQCEGIVQTLDDRRQELPMGTLKQAHTRILFILTRCTRLLQFQKEGAYGNGEHVLALHQFSDLGFYPEEAGSGKSARDMKDRLIRMKIHEHRISCSNLSQELGSQPLRYSVEGADSPGSRNRIASWKKLPSAAEKNQKKVHDTKDVPRAKKVLNSLPRLDKSKVVPDMIAKITGELKRRSESLEVASDYSEDQQGLDDAIPKMICRICDYEIPTLHAEGHIKVCTEADRCDMKGLSIDERLVKVADILERILESWTPKDSDTASVNHEDGSVTTSCKTEESINRNISSQLSSADKMECSSEVATSLMTNHLNILLPISTSYHSTPALSPINTQHSPILTPGTNQIDLKGTYSELEDFQQIQSLLNIARCICDIETIDYRSLEDLSSYLEDLNAIIDDRMVDGLVVETFGRRIEKLLQEKFIHLCGQIDDGTKDSSATVVDEDSSVENGSSHSSRVGPLSLKLKDRTSIEDFEIIKPISRGAFGRVFLAKKRITGDLFAIKVLKKADMVRKNAVESILAERDILISVRNPFVVRFYYSFTCRDNLYLVMEYLNGGDLYSLLRNLGCLSEEMTRIYIAEVVLALEYLHSLNVIHRDLKPDNLLISCDGHIKLTDFGLSKVGLINSTDDLSGPDVSSAVLLGDDHEPVPTMQQAQKREQRQKQSAVGTPDYLAPEILLGMTHGPTADWWSVGVILFELLVGIPPFNAEHPQKIFDNIMNGDIPWPQTPDEISCEAHDLIHKFLIQNPLQRLGATGSQEVKSHPYFKDINWDMLARQKAAFIPSTDGDDDTSYFTCRHAWSSLDDQIHNPSSNYYEDSSDTCSMSCCSSPISEEVEDGDECVHMEEFGAPELDAKYSFSNFSFKNLSQLACMNYDLITKCSKDAMDASNP